MIITYNYLRPTKGAAADIKPTNTIDIGIEDEKGNFMGWSGSAKDTIAVGEFDSTSGYLCRKINPGKWKIIVGAYHVMANGVDVKYNVDFKFKKEKLLFGDMHIHTTASDGSMSEYEVGVAAKKLGLDFIALANHNNYSQNFNLPHIDALTFIPAVEWTHYKGHMNFFGVKNPFENSFVANSQSEMNQLVENAKNRGAVISVNHPKCPICPYLWDNNEIFDMIEVWNGPMTKRNVDAINWWHQMLLDGRKISIIGGSDFHKPKSIAKLGNPVTAVYTQSSSPEDILDALQKGHSYICDTVGSVHLKMNYGKYTMGDTATYCCDTPLSLSCDTDSVVLVTDKGERTVKISSSSTDVFLEEKIKFVYVKVIKGIGKFKKITAISNPVYFD